MFRVIALALVVVGWTAGFAPAQVYIVQSPPRVVMYAPPPVVYYQQPVVTYSSPAPAYSYSYYPPATTTYYGPMPHVAYSMPATVAVPGVVTTRSYVGLGILRPRGIHTETHFYPR